MSKTSRRSFLGLMAGTAGAGWLSGCRSLNLAKDASTYSVALLGDTHFDSTDTKKYHAEYLTDTSKARYELHLKEHVRNADMWADRMPRLLKASGACVQPDAAFALQMGDLVQGDCANPTIHKQMLADMIGLAKSTYGELPFVTVVGNHDIRGTGALKAYDEMMPPVMAAELKRPVPGTTFAFRQGPDAYIVVDFNAPRPDMALFKRLLAKSADARYVFVVTHGPAIPNGNGRWFLLGGPKYDAKRREIRSLMAARNAIVLAGHTHCLEYYDCVFPEGRITQFVANSVWSGEDAAKLVVRDEGAAMYGRRAKEIKMRYGRAVPQKERDGLVRLVDEYRPFVKDYLFANAAGHYRLEVSDARVAVQFFSGDATSPTRTFILRDGHHA